MKSIRKPWQPTLFLPSVIMWSAGNWSKGWTSSVNHSKQCPQKYLPVEYQAFQFRTRKSIKNSDREVSGNTWDESRLVSTCSQDLWDSCPVHDWEKRQRWSSPIARHSPIRKITVIPHIIDTSNEPYKQATNSPEPTLLESWSQPGDHPQFNEVSC